MFQIKTNVMVFSFIMLLSGVAEAWATYNLAVMPVRSERDTKQSFNNLADYITRATGHEVKLKTYPDFKSYWKAIRADEVDFVLDAAHLVDYRVQRKHHQVLAKVKDKVSFSLVTNADNPILDAEELVGKKISVLTFPSRGVLEVNKMFTDVDGRASKQVVKSYNQATFLLETGKVDAAMIPTPMLNRLTNLQVIQTTEQWPHMGFTASSKVPVKVKSSVVRALLRAPKSAYGLEALEHSGLSGFEPADHVVYEGYSQIFGKTF